MRLAFVIFVLGLSGCGGGNPPLSTEQLRDPSSCAPCHPIQYKQWSGSMHAYAAEDPVFRAMNARGQRLTNGALGSFCINCHAPVAVRLGLTRDGLDLDQVPTALRGITCYFCHSVERVTADHGNALSLATDGILRAGIVDPVRTDAHPSAYSALHDRQQKTAAGLCGSCHDVVTPTGVALERTYVEWKDSVYSHDNSRELRTCGKCHMPGTTGAAATTPGAPIRLTHDHQMAAVDTALGDWPEKQAQRAAVEDELRTALASKLCVTPDGNDTKIAVTLDNVAAGHGFPSGASQDRRAWVELSAYKGASVIYQSGAVPEAEEIAASKDPDLWLLRDALTDGTGKPTHDFWEAAKVTSAQLPPSVTSDPSDPRYFHAVTRTYKAPGLPDRVTLRMRIRPFGLDVIDDLVASGDLDPSIRAKVPTFDLGSTVLEWNKGRGYGCVP